MTKEEIEKMEVGPELDALIHESIMKTPTWFSVTVTGGLSNIFQDYEHAVFYCEQFNQKDHIPRSEIKKCYPKYSSDISEAWLVVEKIMEKHDIRLVGIPRQKNEWICEIELHSSDYSEYLAIAPTVPLAICRSALMCIL